MAISTHDAKGNAFSPDGRTMYRSETFQKKIFAYDLDAETGALCPGFGEGGPTGNQGVPARIRACAIMERLRFPGLAIGLLI